jgi:rRNA-processing protein EBP2
MAKSGTLKPALDALKNRNFKLERQRKQEKAAKKKRQENGEDVAGEEGGVQLKVPAEVEVKVKVTKPKANGAKAKKTIADQPEWETDESADEDGSDDDDDALAGATYDLSRLDDSESDISGDDEDPAEENEVEEVDDDDEEEDDEDIALSDIESLASEDKGDIIPHQRLTINNTTALTAALNRIQLPYSKLAFSEHMSVTTDEPVDIPDVEDDLNRELAFYKQALSGAKDARATLKKEGVSFSRPVDYFAEMVKSDEHMGKIKQKLIDDAAGKKASAEARKQRDLKKFGKQVQNAKMQERAKEKRDTMDKISNLKRSTFIFHSHLLLTSMLTYYRTRRRRRHHH